MGNRAVITAEGSKSGVYLHWNGGAESVRAMLRAARDLGVRDPTTDPTYFNARLAQIAGNFFGGSISVGVGALSELDTDNGDNGVYIIGNGFEIIGRQNARRRDDPPGSSREWLIYEEIMRLNKKAFMRMTATVAMDALNATTATWMHTLGEYPHGRLNVSGRKKQSTRLAKCQCDDCGYTVRTTDKWLTHQGAPICPCNSEPMRIC